MGLLGEHGGPRGTVLKQASADHPPKRTWGKGPLSPFPPMREPSFAVPVYRPPATEKEERETPQRVTASGGRLPGCLQPRSDQATAGGPR